MSLWRDTEGRISSGSAAVKKQGNSVTGSLITFAWVVGVLQWARAVPGNRAAITSVGPGVYVGGWG